MAREHCARCRRRSRLEDACSQPLQTMPRPSSISRPSASMATTQARGWMNQRPRSPRAPVRNGGSTLKIAGPTMQRPTAAICMSCGSQAFMVPAAAPSTICAKARPGASSKRARCSIAFTSRISRNPSRLALQGCARAKLPSGTLPTTSLARRRTLSSMPLISSASSLRPRSPLKPRRDANGAQLL